MKKLIAIIVLMIMLLGVTAMAEDLGVHVINPNANAQPLTLDDLKLGAIYTLDEYAEITPVEFQVVDFFAQFKKDANYSSVGGNQYAHSNHVYVDNLNGDWYGNWRWWDAYWNDSGVNAEFVWFMMDVTNFQKKDVNYVEDITVKVVYQDDYEFAGWVRQVNYDYINYGAQGRDIKRYQWDTKHPNVVVLDPANVEPIGMMYTGTYVFGATLPNTVIEDTESPLRMVITIGGNEMTYHIRK